MKTIVAKDGQIHIMEVARPQTDTNFVLVRTLCSAISPGSEIGLLQRSGGRPVMLGYSVVGIVEEVGSGVTHVLPGQRVACYGAPYVRHAEWLAVPKHLAIPLPENVKSDEAAFVGLGAIAIHALRQADLRFGERLIVAGLGILGQMIAQIAQAVGFETIGYDLIAERCSVMSSCGLAAAQTQEQVDDWITRCTKGNGADSILLCTGKNSGKLVDKGLEWIRDRGKVVVVGDLPMHYDRDLMFRKEAQVLISRAGGPGRYDPVYEEQGIDYPIGYVRWTQGRNMEEYIRLLAYGKLRIESLISAKTSVHQAVAAYDSIRLSSQQHLGMIITY